jgi:hypothetical protein
MNEATAQSLWLHWGRPHRWDLERRPARQQNSADPIALPNELPQGIPSYARPGLVAQSLALLLHPRPRPNPRTEDDPNLFA